MAVWAAEKALRVDVGLQALGTEDMLARQDLEIIARRIL